MFGLMVFVLGSAEVGDEGFDAEAGEKTEREADPNIEAEMIKTRHKFLSEG